MTIMIKISGTLGTLGTLVTLVTLVTLNLKPIIYRNTNS